MLSLYIKASMVPNVDCDNVSKHPSQPYGWFGKARGVSRITTFLLALLYVYLTEVKFVRCKRVSKNIAWSLELNVWSRFVVPSLHYP